MKTCAYCGRENDDEAISCRECGTNEFKSSKPFEPEKKEAASKDMETDLVTLTTCRSLMEADMIVSQLRGTGITAFIPDEFLMQTISWNLNTYGYVRVQVSRKDYELAKEFLSASPVQ